MCLMLKDKIFELRVSGLYLVYELFIEDILI